MHDWDLDGSTDATIILSAVVASGFAGSDIIADNAKTVGVTLHTTSTKQKITPLFKAGFFFGYTCCLVRKEHCAYRDP